MATKTDQIIEQALVNKGVLTSEQVAAIRQDGGAGQPLAQALTNAGLVDQETIAEALAQRGLRYVDLGNYQVNPSAVAALSENIARRFVLLPIDFEADELVVAMSDPTDVVALDDLHIITGYRIRPVLSSEADIITAMNHYYKLEESVQQEVDELAMLTAEASDLSSLREVTEDAPVVKLVNLIINRAVNERASDIHVEPEEKDLRVRYRIDGVLHEVMRCPKRIQPGVISRLKIMAGMNIAEVRKPQDGHCDLMVSGKTVDFRVATLPTIYGERVVLRILQNESILLELEQLGFLPDSLARFKSAATKPYGAILVTGPTGSGKSTTLYATLNVLNSPSKNIVTIEDPVEYRLAGINQVQVNAKHGLAFSRGLRAILRTSPDIIMVGEIRDRETAQIAIEAALTGHLVLSTLHTNDAPGAITRLTEMGIAPFLTASAVDCVQAQRLARRLCEACKEAYTPSVEALRRVGFPVEDGQAPVIYKAKGCTKCNHTGYKGRVGIYEIMTVSDRIEQLAVERASADRIRHAAVEEGMKTLLRDGLEKVRLGTTSIEEIMRIIV